MVSSPVLATFFIFNRNKQDNIKSLPKAKERNSGHSRSFGGILEKSFTSNNLLKINFLWIEGTKILKGAYNQRNKEYFLLFFHFNNWNYK